MAGGATHGGMHLATGDKGRSGGGVTDGTGGRGRGNGHIGHDLGRVAVSVTGEVGGMALGTSAACATVDSGVAIAVGTGNAGAAGAVMTGGAGAFVHGGDNIAVVAGAAKRDAGDCGSVAMGMAAEIGGMATGAAATLDDGDIITIGWICQDRSGGMAEGTGVEMDRHGVIGLMAEGDTARGIGDMPQPAGGVIDQTVLVGVVGMAVQAAGGTPGGDDRLDSDSRAIAGLAVGVVAEGTVTLVQSEDTGPRVGELAVTIITVVALGLVGACPHGNTVVVAMTIEVSGVAAGTLAAIAVGRAETAVIHGTVTGGAAKLGMDLACPDKWRGCGRVAAVAGGALGRYGGIGLYRSAMVMGMIVEVEGMAEGTVTRAVDRRAPAVGAVDIGTGHQGVTEGAGAVSAIAVDINDNVAGVAADAEADSANTTMVLDRVVLEIGGVGGVTVGTIRGGKGGDSVLDLLAVAGVTGSTGVLPAGRDIMQGDNVGRGGELAMAGVTAIAAQSEQV